MHRWILLALAAVGGCSPYTINADYDPTADFSKFKTWSWFTAPQPYGAGMDPLIEKRIRASVEEELPHRGLAKAADGSADVLVSYHLSVAQRLEVSPTTATYGYGWGRGYVAYGTSDVRTYDEGTLLVDLIDAPSKSLV